MCRYVTTLLGQEKLFSSIPSRIEVLTCTLIANSIPRRRRGGDTFYTIDGQWITTASLSTHVYHPFTQWVWATTNIPPSRNNQSLNWIVGEEDSTGWKRHRILERGRTHCTSLMDTIGTLQDLGRTEGGEIQRKTFRDLDDGQEDSASTAKFQHNKQAWRVDWVDSGFLVRTGREGRQPRSTTKR
jgi:hypothetical protein